MPYPWWRSDKPDDSGSPDERPWWRSKESGRPASSPQSGSGQPSVPGQSRWWRNDHSRPGSATPPSGPERGSVPGTAPWWRDESKETAGKVASYDEDETQREPAGVASTRPVSQSRGRGPVRRRKWPLAVLAGGLALLIAFGLFAFLKAPASQPHGQLAIQVAELPAGTDASVVVHGPAGTRYPIRQNTRISVPAGDYAVDAAPVQMTTVQYYAITPTTQAHVVTGRTTTVSVDYRTIVPATTKHLIAYPGLSYAASTSTLTVSPTPSEVSSLQPDDYLIVDPIPGAPKGLIVKVANVSAAGPQTTITTTEAYLDQAIPRGHFESRLAVARPTASTESLVRRSPSEHSRIAPTATVQGPAIGIDWSDTYTPSQLQGLLCPSSSSGGPTTTATNVPRSSTTGPPGNSTTTTASTAPSGTQASFTPSVHFHFQPFVDLSADWSFPTHVSVSLAIGATEDFSAGLKSTASYNCDVTKSVDLLPNPPQIEIEVGPFPLIVTPSVTGQGEAKGQATGSDDFTVTQSAGPKATLGFSTDSGFSFGGGLNANPVQVSNQGNASGSAELSVGPTLTLDLEGRGGPSVSVLGYLMAAAKTNPPGAGVWLGSSGNVGIDLDLFVKTITGSQTIYDTGPKLVWHSGATPDVPFAEPTIQTNQICPAGAQCAQPNQALADSSGQRITTSPLERVRQAIGPTLCTNVTVDDRSSQGSTISELGWRIQQAGTRDVATEESLLGTYSAPGLDLNLAPGATGTGRVCFYDDGWQDPIRLEYVPSPNEPLLVWINNP
jgi:hypothetical protein